MFQKVEYKKNFGFQENFHFDKQTRKREFFSLKFKETFIGMNIPQ